MELLNKKEHLDCYLYNNNNEPIIRHITKRKGDGFVINGNKTQIIFLIKGAVTFSYAQHLNKSFTEQTFLLFPHGNKCRIIVHEDCDVIAVNLHSRVNFCDHFPLEMLYQLNKKTKENESSFPLKMNETIHDFLYCLTKSLDDGLKCAYFHELKQKELLFYLRAYYPKKDLFDFFAPILYNDISFAEMVYKNFDKAKNITELASLTNYSISGFKKRFLKVFGMPPYTWIAKEKAKKIFHEINCTQKSFKEISMEYDFSSPAHFDKFCKKLFGMSPGTIRENTRLNVLLD
jgi:AraC-like DNA-binding protein